MSRMFETATTIVGTNAKNQETCVKRWKFHKLRSQVVLHLTCVWQCYGLTGSLVRSPQDVHVWWWHTWWGRLRHKWGIAVKINMNSMFDGNQLDLTFKIDTRRETKWC